MFFFLVFWVILFFLFMTLFFYRSHRPYPTTLFTLFTLKHVELYGDLVLANRGSVACLWFSSLPCSLGVQLEGQLRCIAPQQFPELMGFILCSPAELMWDLLRTVRTDEYVKILLSSTNCLCPAYEASCVGKIPSKM